MDRLKSARVNSSGGRIEGMSKVATSGGGWFSRLFGGSARGGGSVAEGEGEGDEDESLIWGTKGPFRWEDIEGVDIEWGCSGLGMVDVGQKVEKGEKEQATEARGGDGLDDVMRFLSDL